MPPLKSSKKTPMSEKSKNTTTNENTSTSTSTIPPSTKNISDSNATTNQTSSPTSTSPNSSSSSSNTKKTTIKSPLSSLKSRAKAAFDSSDYESAIRYYSEAITHSPNDKLLYCNRSLCYINTYQYNEALSDANQAILIDPTHPRGYHRRGVVYERIYDLQHAEADFAYGLELSPKDAALKLCLSGLQNRLATISKTVSSVITPVTSIISMSANSQIGIAVTATTAPTATTATTTATSLSSSTPHADIISSSDTTTTTYNRPHAPSSSSSATSSSTSSSSSSSSSISSDSTVKLTSKKLSTIHDSHTKQILLKILESTNPQQDDVSLVNTEKDVGDDDDDDDEEDITNPITNPITMNDIIEQNTHTNTNNNNNPSNLKSNSKSNIANPESGKFIALTSWLLSGGAKFPKLFLEYYDVDSRGVCCKDDLHPNELVLYIPHRHILTSEVARASKIGCEILSSSIELRSKHSFIAAYILEEMEKGINSFWWPYFSVLPIEFSNVPLFFKEDELSNLTGSCTLWKIAERLLSLRIEYHNLCTTIPRFARFSYDQFAWARIAVITRIFGIIVDNIKTDGLVPLADMLNHKLPRETRWSYDSPTRGFVVSSIASIKKGDQVFDSYGRKCNSRFFVNYGFCVDENEENESMLRLQLAETKGWNWGEGCYVLCSCGGVTNVTNTSSNNSTIEDRMRDTISTDDINKKAERDLTDPRQRNAFFQNQLYYWEPWKKKHTSTSISEKTMIERLSQMNSDFNSTGLNNVKRQTHEQGKGQAQAQDPNHVIIEQKEQREQKDVANMTTMDTHATTATIHAHAPTDTYIHTDPTSSEYTITSYSLLDPIQAIQQAKTTRQYLSQHSKECIYYDNHNHSHNHHNLPHKSTHIDRLEMIYRDKLAYFKLLLLQKCPHSNALNDCPTSLTISMSDVQDATSTTSTAPSVCHASLASNYSSLYSSKESSVSVNHNPNLTVSTNPLQQDYRLEGLEKQDKDVDMTHTATATAIDAKHNHNANESNHTPNALETIDTSDILDPNTLTPFQKTYPFLSSVSTQREYQIPANLQDKKAQDMFTFLRIAEASPDELIQSITQCKVFNNAGVILGGEGLGVESTDTIHATEATMNKTNKTNLNSDVDQNILDSFYKLSQISLSPSSSVGIVQDFEKPISLRNEIAALKSLQRACLARLSEFPTTLEQDIDLLLAVNDGSDGNDGNDGNDSDNSDKENTSLSPDYILPLYSNIRNCVLMRKGEKEILEWFIWLTNSILAFIEEQLLQQFTTVYNGLEAIDAATAATTTTTITTGEVLAYKYLGDYFYNSTIEKIEYQWKKGYFRNREQNTFIKQKSYPYSIGINNGNEQEKSIQQYMYQINKFIKSPVQ